MGSIKVYTSFTKTLHQTPPLLDDAQNYNFMPSTKLKAPPPLWS